MHQEGFAAGFSAAELMDSAHGSDCLQTVQRLAGEMWPTRCCQGVWNGKGSQMGAFGQIARKNILKALWNRGLSSALLQDIFATRAKGKYLFDPSWGTKSPIFYISLQLKQKGKNLVFDFVSVCVSNRWERKRGTRKYSTSLPTHRHSTANIIRHLND